MHLEHALIHCPQIVLFADFMHILQDLDQLLVTLLPVKVHHWDSVAQVLGE